MAYIAAAALLAQCLCFAQQVQVYETYGDQSKKLERRVLPLVFSVQPAPPSSAAIRIDESTIYQTVDGFGASLTHSSAYVIHQLNKPGQRALLRVLFNAKDGAGLSLLRQPMGASDFSARGNFSYQDSEAGPFSIDPDLEFTIPLLREAVKINPRIRLVALPWSAPAWMKTNASMNGGSLRPDRYPALASYFVQFLQAYKAQGLPVYAVAMQNEPLFQTPAYPSTLVPARDQAVFLGQHLAPALATAGLGSVRILAYDHNWDHPEYPDTVAADPVAGPAIAGAAFHCYGGDVSAQGAWHESHPTKDIWFTECSGSVGSSFAGDLAWNARNLLIGATRNWAKGVLLWNLVLDQNSGPKNGGCDKCRGVLTVDLSANPPSVEKNVEYFVLAHAAKFVEPGAVRIDTNAGSAGGIQNVAFRNPDGSIVMLVSNDSATAAATFTVEWRGKTIAYSLPKQSLATLRWRP